MAFDTAWPESEIMLRLQKSKRFGSSLVEGSWVMDHGFEIKAFASKAARRDSQDLW